MRCSRVFGAPILRGVQFDKEAIVDEWREFASDGGTEECLKWAAIFSAREWILSRAVVGQTWEDLGEVASLQVVDVVVRARPQHEAVWRHEQRREIC
jgi:hypothetical protein